MYNVLSLLLIFQSFVACKMESEKATPSATDIIFKSTDNGLTWQDISAKLPSSLPIDCLLAQQDEIFLGNTDGLFHSKITSTDPIWEKVPLMMTGKVTDIFPGRAGLFAFSSSNGFTQNVSKGIWVSAFSAPEAAMFRTIFESADGTLFYGADNGIFKSADRGQTWKHVYQHGWMIRMVESEGVLLCTNQNGILRSTDGGEHWDLVISEGGVGIQVEVIEGGFAAITYNTESETRRVRTSADGGKTWQAIDAGLPADASIASIKQVGDYYFCGHPDGIFRSSDKGKTWVLQLPAIGKKVFNLSVVGNVIYAIPRDGGC